MRIFYFGSSPCQWVSLCVGGAWQIRTRIGKHFTSVCLEGTRQDFMSRKSVSPSLERRRRASSSPAQSFLAHKHCVLRTYTNTHSTPTWFNGVREYSSACVLDKRLCERSEWPILGDLLLRVDEMLRILEIVIKCNLLKYVQIWDQELWIIQLRSI